MSLAIGIDIGGTSMKLGLVAADGTVLAREGLSTQSGENSAAIVETLARAIGTLAEKAPRGETAAFIGIGCAGLIDVEHGVVGLSPNLPSWRDVPLRDLLSDATGLPVALINDADAFGHAEALLGAGKGSKAGLFVTLGTGVGGAIWLDGHFVHGAHGIAGEVGHMCIDVRGPECPCGGRGCLEQFVGNARIVERAELKIRNGALGQGIVEAAGGAGCSITPKAIAQAANGGDLTARAVFAEVGEILGTAFAGLGNLLGLDVIVLGGGVAEAGEVLLAPTRRALSQRSMFPEHQKPRVVPSRFGVDAGLVGACVVARQRFAA